jgi:hypothetical protein
VYLSPAESEPHRGGWSAKGEEAARAMTGDEAPAGPARHLGHRALEGGAKGRLGRPMHLFRHQRRHPATKKDVRNNPVEERDIETTRKKVLELIDQQK